LDLFLRALPHQGAAALLLLALTGPAFSAHLASRASIIDGDTLEIHGAHIRLSDIDAPESSQRGKIPTHIDAAPRRSTASTASSAGGW
jgi:endonuclease YncB( thermonuclease family)